MDRAPPLLTDAIGTAYEIAASRSAWSDLLPVLSSLFAGEIAHIRTAGIAPENRIQKGVPEHLWRVEAAKLFKGNPLFAAVQKLPAYQPLVVNHLAERRDILSTQLSDELLSPLRARHCISVWPKAGTSYFISLGITRLGARPFDEIEMRAASTMVRHLERANRMRHVLSLGFDLERTADRFGLTRREAAVAREIALGHSVEEAAAALRVGRETIRTHLKALYAKTGTSSQAGLVRVLLIAEPFA